MHYAFLLVSIRFYKYKSKYIETSVEVNLIESFLLFGSTYFKAFIGHEEICLIGLRVLQFWKKTTNISKNDFISNLILLILKTNTFI